MTAMTDHKPHPTGPQEPRWTLHSALPTAGALPTAPKLARGFTADALAYWGLSRWEDDASLIASELVTNVVQQAHDRDGKPIYPEGRLPVFQLSLFSDRRRLLLAVWDDAPGFPVQGNATPDATCGRGLAMISRLGAWDWHLAGRGKVVRATIGGGA